MSSLVEDGQKWGADNGVARDSDVDALHDLGEKAAEGYLALGLLNKNPKRQGEARRGSGRRWRRQERMPLVQGSPLRRPLRNLSGHRHLFMAEQGTAKPPAAGLLRARPALAQLYAGLGGRQALF